MFELSYVIGVFLFVYVAPHIGVNVMRKRCEVNTVRKLVFFWIVVASALAIWLLLLQVKAIAVVLAMLILTFGLAIYAISDVNNKIHYYTSNEPQKG